ncbi:hypothetical protein [Ellagibacter isourolithinifaciens]|uniref:hypothetical protein n=1 Tax=Ellagibacter isourolithinifaciens TaxID=2137581 RepID=UPI002E76A69D|nr:hypothetical protein [Ellagibacter isourolithinifaciens]MEE0246234.1 hypothetical protein [Ellagibacter isourolithinifaciens]
MDTTNNRNFKTRVSALALSLVVAAAAATPALAFADGTTASQSTEVTVQSATPDPGGDNLSFSVPTQIPFVAKADGTMLAPSADTLKIQNRSVFPIHVVNMAVTEQSPFKLVADVAASSDANAFQFMVNGLQADASVDTSANTAWNMGYADSANNKISLDITDAKIARVTTDITTPQKAATITWTVASGAAQ